MKRPHRKVVGAAVVKGKLFVKVSQGEKRVARVEPFLIFPVTALHLAVVPRGVRTNELVADAKFMGSIFKKGGDVPLAVGKAVGKLKAVVGLDTFHTNASAGVPLH